MKGVHQKSLTGELFYVPQEYNAKPVQSITNPDEKLDFCRERIDHEFGAFSFYREYFRLPLAALRNFSFDELCKMQYSTGISMPECVRTRFRKFPNHRVVSKIANSMWRWGVEKGTWNEVVDAYEGIRNFSLDLDNPDFALRLDHTTGCNQYGWSEYSRTYIDGVFSFLVYYRKQHVMTISFSIMGGHRILLQQVQLRQPTGNRWLYKFPSHRLEYVIGQFEKYFPSFALHVIDADSLVQKILREYRDRLNFYEEQFPGERLEEVGLLRQKITHLYRDRDRLTQFYTDCGNYQLGEALRVNELTHYRLRDRVQQVA